MVQVLKAWALVCLAVVGLAGCQTTGAARDVNVIAAATQIAPAGQDKARATLTHQVRDAGGMQGKFFPPEVTKLVDRGFLLGIAREAQRRNKPYFRLTNLDRDGTSRGIDNDGAGLVKLKITYDFSSNVEFLDVEPKTAAEREDVYETQRILAFGATKAK